MPWTNIHEFRVTMMADFTHVTGVLNYIHLSRQWFLMWLNVTLFWNLEYGLDTMRFVSRAVLDLK